MPRWPETPGEARGYIAVMERNVRFHDHRWQARWSSAPLDDVLAFGGPSIAPSQEDAVFLSEVLDELERELGTDKARRFVEDCDGRRAERVTQRREYRTAVERMQQARQRGRLRAWVEENS